MSVFWYCTIRKISVERRGRRIKRFFVSEAQGAELENLTKYRGSETPGDFLGASFWYFLREKVRRSFGGKGWNPRFMSHSHNEVLLG